MLSQNIPTWQIRDSFYNLNYFVSSLYVQTTLYGRQSAGLLIFDCSSELCKEGRPHVPSHCMKLFVGLLKSYPLDSE